ncbi:MAG: Ada metal-binding domain-containing protein [Pyrinomonadaceae bacterium]
METEVLWRAVEARDARFDGAFVFGVKTTGIFCRPSWSARTFSSACVAATSAV